MRCKEDMRSKTLEEVKARVKCMHSLLVEGGDEGKYSKRNIDEVEKALISFFGFIHGVEIATEEMQGEKQDGQL